MAKLKTVFDPVERCSELAQIRLAKQQSVSPVVEQRPTQRDHLRIPRRSIGNRRAGLMDKYKKVVAICPFVV